MNLDQLREKASMLPLQPGVYLMKDLNGEIIYVGKAKRLKSRVSQYFQDTASHTPKTKIMVSKIDHFDVIVAASEFEALVLECSLIKRHQPKYNILLKDDKGYPYIRLDIKSEYPQMTMVNRIADDSAEYFGPFGSRGVTNELMQTIRLTLKLPHCSKRFPRDIGKSRPCLHHHMDQCEGWCQDTQKQDRYRQSIEQARLLLQGNYKELADTLRQQMQEAADALRFELAASLRDRLNAVEKLGQKQLVATDSFADMDVIGYGQTETTACFTVLHFSNGNLIDKDYELFPVPDDPSAAVSSLMKQYYLNRGAVPKVVFLPFAVEDSELFESYILQHFGRKTRFKVPQRGDNRRYVELAVKNAVEEAQRVDDREDRALVVVSILAKMLNLQPFSRIESYDISNISGTDIVASMVVFQNGRPRRSDYRHFKINGLTQQDDYASMYQVIQRRFKHYIDRDQGFDTAPGILLIDGGVTHAKTAVDALAELSLDFPVFGMVKDDRHRTRALVTPDGREIRIDNNQSIFALIGRIQEETHRFAIMYHRKLRSKRLRYSELDGISGIGPKRKEILLKAFKSIAAIRGASLSELEQHLSKDAAYSVYSHFRDKGDK